MILSRWFKLDKSVEKSREGIFSRIASVFEQPRPIDDDLWNELEVEEEGVAHLEGDDRQVDCIFNDLLNSFPDESVVERAFELSLARLRPGGLLLADNALGRGEVAAPTSRQGRNIRRYNDLVARAPQLESLIVPLRDGVSIARRTD